MKIYTIILHYPECKFTMPYYFTNCEEAILFGEYEFREDYDLEYYEIEKFFKPNPFYKLK